MAQVSINADSTSPHNSAMLDVKSAIKGFLPPRVALTSLIVSSPVSSPVATGLLVFNTATSGTAPNNVVPAYYYWSGAKWVTVSTPLATVPGLTPQTSYSVTVQATPADDGAPNPYRAPELATNPHDVSVAVE